MEAGNATETTGRRIFTRMMKSDERVATDRPSKLGFRKTFFFFNHLIFHFNSMRRKNDE